MNETLAAQTWKPGLPQLIAAFLLGAVGVAVAFSLTGPIYPLKDLPEMGIDAKQELIDKHDAAIHAYQTSNATLNFGVLGAAIGLLTGLITTSRRRIPSAIIAAVAGGLAGAVSGYFAGNLVADHVFASADQTLLKSFGFHFAIWGSILAITLGSIGLIQNSGLGLVAGLIAGLVGGCCSSIAYNLVGAIAFPKSDLTLLFPRDFVQCVVWAAACALAAAVVAQVALQGNVSEKKESAESEEKDWPVPESEAASE